MKTYALALLLAAGCAPATYLYNFDITDPGARNFPDPRRPDVLEDADLKIELRVDPTEFKAIAFEVTNKTESQVQLPSQGLSMIGPDHEQHPVSVLIGVPPVEPGAKIATQLGPFELPAVGPLAKAYDDSTFELVVPFYVRGQLREYRFHLHAHTQKI